NAEGIPCSVGSCGEIYREKAFISNKLQPRKRYLTAKKLGDTSLMFMVHPTLSVQDIEDTCMAIEKVMEYAQNREYVDVIDGIV
ncbi:MAG: hypothetical protein HY779_04485, partial [Rubrobacteridae bacterium]|nr:hypothetical protein [Rubrobacteridae bacterium]